jgi:hypothetical protein
MIEVNIPNLVGGVTQQAEALRFPAQVEAQVNVIPSIISGSTSRNGTDYRGSLTGDFTPDTFIHDINRDSDERYSVLIQGGNLQVFNSETGAEFPVSFPDGKDYLTTSGTPIGAFKALTVSDTTFIANTEKGIAQGVEASGDAPADVLLFIKQGAYGVDYSVTLNSGDFAAKAVISAQWSNVGTSSCDLNISLVSGGSGYTVLPTIIAVVQSNTSSYHRPNWKTRTYTLVQDGVWNTSMQTNGAPTVIASLANNSIESFSVSASIKQQQQGYSQIVKSTNNTTRISSPDSPPEAIAPVTITHSASKTEANQISTRYIATKLKNALAASGNLSEYTFTKSENLIRISRVDGTYFETSVSDGAGDSYIGLVQKSVESLDGLPTNCYDGYSVKVIGDSTESADDYYLRFSTNNGAEFGLGAWVETIAPNTITAFNTTTMPHVLLSLGGSFEFKRAPWADRLVGDDETNAFPKIEGQGVSALSYTQERLGLFVGDTFVYSETSQPYNMFRTTVTNVLDTQPIELEITDEAVSNIEHVSLHEGNILLFAEKAQYILDLSEGFTFDKVSLSQSTRTEFSSSCKPIALNADTFFCFPRGDSVGLKQFSVDKNTLKLRTYDISAHVPRYITKEPYLITGVPSEDMLLIHTTDERDGCFVYRFVDKNGERVQSSFSKLTLGGLVLHSYVIDSLVYFLIRRGGVTHIERWNPAVGQFNSAEGVDFPTLLDHRVTDADATLSYDGGTDITTFTLPTDIESGAELAICTRGANAGTLLATLDGDGSASYGVSGDLTGQELWIGLTFATCIELTRPTVMKPTGGGGQVAVTGGNFQVLYGRLTVNDCFPFSVVVSQKYRDPYTYTMKETDLGVLPTIPATPNDGEYRFPVYGRSDKVTVTLKNNTPYPSSWLSLAWEGRYTKTNTTL